MSKEKNIERIFGPTFERVPERVLRKAENGGELTELEDKKDGEG